MSKLIRKETFVHVSTDGTPACITFEGNTILVQELLDHWHETGEWWKNKPPKDFFRVLTTHGVLDIYRVRTPGDKEKEQIARWILYRKLD